METLAVVLMVLGLIGAGSALVVLVRLRGQLERLGEQVDRVTRWVEALPPDLSRVVGNRDRHIISVELVSLFELAHREMWMARPLSHTFFNRTNQQIFLNDVAGTQFECPLHTDARVQIPE
jgi:hypothetical protein